MNIEDSCLGALYLHSLPGTLKHCHFELGETCEHVFQTGPSQWLVSGPETFSLGLQCEKSHETIFVKHISSITVNPGCKLYLKFCTRKLPQPLDEALKNLESREQLQALGLKNQIRDYEQELQTSHQNFFTNCMYMFSLSPFKLTPLFKSY